VSSTNFTRGPVQDIRAAASGRHPVGRTERLGVFCGIVKLMLAVERYRDAVPYTHGPRSVGEAGICVS